MALIGSPVQRREDRELLMGRGRFIDNLSLPGTVHFVVVRSPFAHARIRAVDVEAARRAPGVVTALTGRDLRDEWAAPLPVIWPVGGDVLVPDHWPLAVEVARYAGDGVAVVVAETRAAAKDAAELVDVEYEPMAAVIDAERALESGAPLVHPELGTNRCYRFAFAHGQDIGVTMATADIRLTRTFRQQRVIPSPMEPRGVVVRPTPERDELVMWTSTQIPHLVRRTLAGCVGIPEHRLRVIAPDVGGGFGAKLNVYAEEALALVLARRLGRPVKWVEERSEHSLATTHGRGQLQRVEIAARADGKITGIRVSLVASMGAYLQLETPGIPVIGRILYGGAYGADSYDFECVGVFTNQTPTGAYRGAGRPEAIYAIERMTDVLAAELELDPAEVRRRNFLPEGAWVPNAAGILYDSVAYEKALDRALELVGYGNLRAGQARRRQAGSPRQLGIGIGFYVDSSGSGPSAVLARTNYQSGGWEAATVRVLASGKVEVETGVSPQGQGHVTVLSQIVADALGVGMEDVRVSHGDTAEVSMGVGTFGSRSLVVGGTAVHHAAQKVLAKARAIAAHLLEAGVEDVVFEGGRFSLIGAPERGVPLAEVARAAYLAHDLPGGMEPGLEERTVYDPPDWSYPFGTHVAVVEVDIETGHVDLVRYVAVDDCGTVVNPLLVEGQIHGGLAQGIGQALFEEAGYNEEGQLETGSLLNYLVPSAAEVPPFELDRTVTPSDTNPLGAKGIGEAGTIAAPPAVMNAVHDALAPFGVGELDMPATPERVWRALRTAPGRPGVARGRRER